MIKEFKTKGVCSSGISVDVENGVIKNVVFYGGCNGNTKGVAALAKGRPVDEVIKLLKDIKCGSKNSSCPAQLANALEQMKNC